MHFWRRWFLPSMSAPAWIMRVFFSLMEVDYLLSGLLGPILSTTTIIWSTAKEDAADAHNV